MYIYHQKMDLDGRRRKIIRRWKCRVLILIIWIVLQSRTDTTIPYTFRPFFIFIINLNISTTYKKYRYKYKLYANKFKKKSVSTSIAVALLYINKRRREDMINIIIPSSLNHHHVIQDFNTITDKWLYYCEKKLNATWEYCGLWTAGCNLTLNLQNPN